MKRAAPKNTLPIPRFVRALNAVAEKAGFTVNLDGLGRPRSDYEEDVIVSTWSGSRRAWKALDFLPHTVWKVGYEGGVVQWPLSNANVILRGFLSVEKNRIVVKVDGGPAPRSLRKCGAIEIAEYDDCTAHHGTMKALIASGTCVEKHFPGSARVTKRDGGDPWTSPPTRAWWTAKYPDGSYVHRVETDSALATRTARYEEYHRESHSTQQQQIASPLTRTTDGTLAQRMDALVAEAVRDFKRARDTSLGDYYQRKKICARIVNGIPGRAHGWCVDFRGASDALVVAGLAQPEWFKGNPLCKGVNLSGRNIELYRECSEYELTVSYTESERESIWDDDE